MGASPQRAWTLVKHPPRVSGDEPLISYLQGAHALLHRAGKARAQGWAPHDEGRDTPRITGQIS